MQHGDLNGTYECTLDNRFRLAIPAKFRDPFEDGVAMAWWLDDQVVVAPRADWPRIVSDVFGELQVLNDDQRRLRRYLLAGTYEQDALDKQGRILIPEKLRTLAGLESKVSVVGGGEYLELWNPARLDASFEDLRREGVSNLGKRLVESGR